MVQLEGFEAALREETARVAEARGREAIEAWVDITNDLLRRAPQGIGTARMDDWNLDAIADSVEIRQRRGEGGQFAPGWVAEWTAETDDGIPLIDLFEFGTPPHPIEGNPVLRWTDDETGETVFATRVEHPGIPEVAAVRIGARKVEMAIDRGEIEG